MDSPHRVEVSGVSLPNTTLKATLSEKWSLIRLVFYRIFNTGSPYNVPAGHSIDLGAVIAHYEKQNAATEERRIERVTRQAEDAELQAQKQATERNRKSSILQQLGLAKPDA